MGVKFRIGFTITPEVLFGIIGKVLPLEDLHIEQIVNMPTPAPDPKWYPTPVQAQRVMKAIAPKHKKHIKREPRIPVRLDAGINAIIIKMLKTGPCKAIELREHLVAAGYSPNSVGSRLQALETKNIVKRSNDGWLLVKPIVTPEMRKVVEEYHDGVESE